MEECILNFIAVVFEPFEHRHVTVYRLVDDAVQQAYGRAVRSGVDQVEAFVHCLLRMYLVVHDAQQVVTPQEHVHLAQAHLFFGIQVDGGAYHRKQGAFVAFKFGALMPVRGVFERKFVQVEGLLKLAQLPRVRGHVAERHACAALTVSIKRLGLGNPHTDAVLLRINSTGYIRHRLSVGVGPQVLKRAFIRNKEYFSPLYSNKGSFMQGIYRMRR